MSRYSGVSGRGGTAFLAAAVAAVAAVAAIGGVSGCKHAADTSSPEFRKSFQGDPSRMPANFKNHAPRMPAGAPVPAPAAH